MISVLPLIITVLSTILILITGYFIYINISTIRRMDKKAVGKGYIVFQCGYYVLLILVFIAIIITVNQ